MKSHVISMPDPLNLPLKSSLFEIEIPSWEAVAQPLLDHAIAQYNVEEGENLTELTDQMVEQLDLPVNTIEELVTYGVEVYQHSQRTAHFHYYVMPQILSQLTELTKVSLDKLELEQYQTEYMDRLQVEAKDRGVNLSDYAKHYLHLETSDVQATFLKRAREDFYFKLVAHKYYDDQGGTFEPADYDAFIQQQVIHYGADEIQLRQDVPYDLFVEIIPEYELSQLIEQHYEPQIQFVVNPEAPLQYLK